MNLSHSEVHLYPRDACFARPPGMQAAVSLHSHSECSRETLEFIPRLAKQIPVVAVFYERGMAQYQRQHGQSLDLGEWYFRPPMSPAGLIAAERTHLTQRLDLPGLVSMTDHDTVEGPQTLRSNGQTDVPLSLEWSVPYDGCLFHLGVHGISPASIDAIMRALAAYTASSPVSATRPLGELLEWLCECAETLIVLNHPYWDLADVGQLRHDSTLFAFLRAHKECIHALELNGYRSWDENRLVLPLAKGFDLPLVGGGDRHALAPNAIVNLTHARDFAEFVYELRVGRRSHCVVFPEYADPFVARILQSAADILGPLPHHHRGQITWAERVFITVNGREQSVASMWEREPLWLRGVVAITRAIASKRFAVPFELTRSDGHKTLVTDCRLDTVFGGVPVLGADSAAA